VDTWGSCQSLCERDTSAAEEAIRPLFTAMLEIFEDMQTSASSELNGRACIAHTAYCIMVPST
jgi:hypothetical protein